MVQIFGVLNYGFDLILNDKANHHKILGACYWVYFV